MGESRIVWPFRKKPKATTEASFALSKSSCKDAVDWQRYIESTYQGEITKNPANVDGRSGIEVVMNCQSGDSYSAKGLTTSDALMSLLSTLETSCVVRFGVERSVNGRDFQLYEGPSGAEARKRFEHVVRLGESGKMELWMENHLGRVVRGSYERIA